MYYFKMEIALPCSYSHHNGAYTMMRHLSKSMVNIPQWRNVASHCGSREVLLTTSKCKLASLAVRRTGDTFPGTKIIQYISENYGPDRNTTKTCRIPAVINPHCPQIMNTRNVWIARCRQRAHMQNT